MLCKEKAGGSVFYSVDKQWWTVTKCLFSITVLIKVYGFYPRVAVSWKVLYSSLFHLFNGNSFSSIGFPSTLPIIILCGLLHFGEQCLSCIQRNITGWWWVSRDLIILYNHFWVSIYNVAILFFWYNFIYCIDLSIACVAIHIAGFGSKLGLGSAGPLVSNR